MIVDFSCQLRYLYSQLASQKALAKIVIAWYDLEKGLTDWEMLLPLVGLALAGVWYLLDYYFIPKHSTNEPPLVSSYIPYIGHIIGLLHHGSRYYEVIRYFPQHVLSEASKI